MFKQEIINEIENVKNDWYIKNQFRNINNLVESKGNQPLNNFSDIKISNLNFSNMVYQIVGVYCFVNLKNGSAGKQIIYIGQTQNLCERLDIHRSELFSGMHSIKALQNDFTPEVEIKDFKSIHENLFCTTFFYTLLKYQLSEDDKTKLNLLLREVEREIIRFFVEKNRNVYNAPYTYM